MHKTLWFPPPPRFTLRYPRGQFCGLRVPGLPAVDGGARDASLVFSPFLDRYAPAQQDRIIDRNLECGYDTIKLSWPDSRAAGKSIRDYVAMSKYCQDAGLEPIHMLLSKCFDGLDPDPRLLDPVIDALLNAGAIRRASYFWEGNAFISPERMLTATMRTPWLSTPYAGRITQYLAGRLVPNGVLCYLHFLPHYVTWQANVETPHDFWARQCDYGTQGVLYQGDPAWSAGMLQARLNDCLVRLIALGLWGLPRTVDVVADELTAQTQFNGELDEDHGDLRGLEALCAVGPMPVMGFNNGARYPDGRPI